MIDIAVYKEKLESQLNAPHPSYKSLIFNIIFVTFLFKYIYSLLYFKFAEQLHLAPPTSGEVLTTDYKLTFFFIITSVALLYSAYYLIKYPKALGNEIRLNKSLLFKALFCALPLVIYNLRNIIDFLLDVTNQKESVISALSHYAWTPFG